jgi:hypothetical protein
VPFAQRRHRFAQPLPPGAADHVADEQDSHRSDPIYDAADGEIVSDREKIVERATDYPYEIPDRSFVQTGDETRALSGELRLESRIPVLAFGSNAAPEVLVRKFGMTDDSDQVPVLRARLRDFDIVYSAHISAYGSVPAAIQLSPGTTVSTYVTYLTPEQLTAMSRTEPNYTLVQLDPVSCELETGVELNSVASYLSRHGCLAVDGGEVALAAVDAEGRRFPEWDEEEAIEHARRLLAPGLGLEEFIAGSVESRELAGRRTAALKQDALPFAGSSRNLPEY